MDSQENHDDLNERLRSMILSNAQDQRRQNNGFGSAAQAPQSNDSKDLTGRGGFSGRSRPNGQNRARNRASVGSVDSSGNPSRGRGQRSPRAPQVSPISDRIPPSSVRSSHQNTQQRSILSNRGRGRALPLLSDDTQRGASRGGRMGARPSSFRPLNRPQRLTAEEVQMQGLHLEKLAEDEIPKVEMTKQERDDKGAFRSLLNSVLQKAVSQHYGENAPQISLLPFGSLASGFGMPGSDMDLALKSSHIPSDMPRLLETTLLQHGLGARLLTRTRVPILKVCEKPTPDLYKALCEEREKWDNMTIEERQESDRGSSKKKDSEKMEPSPGDKTSISSTGLPQHEGASKVEAPLQEFRKGRDSVTTPQQASVSVNVTKQRKAEGNSVGELPKTPLTPQTPQAEMTPEQLQYTQLVDALRKDRPHELDQWITSNPPPPGLDLQMVLHGKTDPRTPRKEKPWYREKPLGPLDFPKDAVGILCDINFSNPLGIHNTELLHAYATCDVRVRLMVLFVKLWAGRRKINSGYNGTLSSYGYVLMVLHFLVNIASPPVCPNLQIWETSRIGQSSSGSVVRDFINPDPEDPHHMCEGADVRFHRNEAEIQDLASRQLLTHNREPLGMLLRNFFLYYATQGPGSPRLGFNWTRDVLSLRLLGGIQSKVDKGWTGARTTEEEGGKEIKHRYLFAIEDPFELEHNVGRTVTHHGIVAIRDEFRRTARILDKVAHGGYADEEGPLLEALIVEMPPRTEKENEQSVQLNDSTNMKRTGKASQELLDNRAGMNKDV